MVAVAAGAEAEAEAITPLNTCETPIPWALCFGKTYICIPLCVGMHHTGGYCQQQQMRESDAEPAGFGGAICVCTKQCLAEAEAAGGPSSQPPVEPPLGMRGIGMLN